MGPSPKAGFDHHIDRAAGDDEVLDVVPPDKDELAALIDRCRLDHASLRSRGRKKPWGLERPPKKVLNAHTRSAPMAITNNVAATARMSVLRSSIDEVSYALQINGPLSTPG